MAKHEKEKEFNIYEMPEVSAADVVYPAKKSGDNVVVLYSAEKGRFRYNSENYDGLLTLQKYKSGYLKPDKNPGRKFRFFRHWYYDADLEKKVEKDDKVTNPEKHTLYAKYSINLLWIIIPALLLLLALLLALLMGWLDPNAHKGQYNGKSLEQIQKELDQQISENELYVSIANTIKFEEGCPGWGIANIDNIENNQLDQKVKIVLSDTGETIYETQGAIAPGYYIDKIWVDKELAKGSYNATAYFTGYKHNWPHEEVGTLAADIKLEVS